MREIFSFHNASPQLTCKILSEAVHRHNMDCTNALRGRRRTYFHYDTWIYDRLQIVTRNLFGPQNMLFPDWINTQEFQVAESTVGIAKLSDKLREKCGMDEYNESDWPKEKSQKQMQFMAKQLGTKKPILPVHTKQERNLFKKLEPRYVFKTEIPDAMVKAWNVEASKTKGVYYKTSSLLTKYYNKHIVTDSLRSLTFKGYKMPALKDRMGETSGSQPSTLSKDHAWRPLSAGSGGQAAELANQTQQTAMAGNDSSGNASSSNANGTNVSSNASSSQPPANNSNLSTQKSSNVQQLQAAFKPVAAIIPAPNICYVPVMQIQGNHLFGSTVSTRPHQITDRTVKKVKQSFSPTKGESQGMKGPVAIGPIAGHPTIATLNFGGSGSKASTSRQPRKCAVCGSQRCKGTGARKFCPWSVKGEDVQSMAREINRMIMDENERARLLIDLLEKKTQGTTGK